MQDYYNYLENGSDTFGISGNSWIVESVADRTVDIVFYNEMDTTKSGIAILYSLTSIDLPGQKNIIACDKESTILGESYDLLFSKTQMKGNGILM